MNGFRIRKNKFSTTCIIAKNKDKNKQELPKAFVIKIEDMIPRRLYKNLVEQKVIDFTNGGLSTWYTSNREHCVLYLQRLCKIYKLRENTFFSALSYADRLMRNSRKLTKKEFDLKIIACLILASKYVENEAYELDMNDFISLEFDCIYEMKDIKRYEVNCLKELQYELHETTAYDFLICQIACGVIFKDEAIEKNAVNSFVNNAKDILLQSAFSPINLLYKPETIALCVIQYCRYHFVYLQQRISLIKEKLKFDDVDFESCYDFLTR